MSKIKMLLLALSLFPLWAFATTQYTVNLDPLSYSKMAPATVLSVGIIDASKKSIGTDQGMISMYTKSVNIHANAGPFPQNLYLVVNLELSFCGPRDLPFAYSSAEELNRCYLQLNYQNSFPYTCDTYKVSINKLCR